jgi:cytochrome c
MKLARLIALVAVFPVCLSSCGFGSGYDGDGESIFMTGKTREGDVVQNFVDRDALRDKDLVLSCAACHGADAGGGKNTIASFGPYVAPPLQWSVLTSTQDGVPYTESSFIAAVRTGIAPEGYRLHHPMPTWELKDEHLSEIITFLKTK